jgi:hypothetical protein
LDFSTFSFHVPDMFATSAAVISDTQNRRDKTAFIAAFIALLDAVVRNCVSRGRSTFLDMARMGG